MKIRIVSKFIAVGLVMLAVGKTCSFAGPVEPHPFSGDYERLVQKRIWDSEQILNDTRNAQFYPTTEDSLMVAISRAHNANGAPPSMLFVVILAPPIMWPSRYSLI
jgi:hypothetical protein